jgi:hypothetical protein
MDLRPLDDDYSPYEDEEIIEGGPSTLKRLLGVALTAMVVVTGVTIAANINLNSGIKVDFGTGAAGTSLCDSSLSVTPLSGFDNTTTPTSITNPSVNGSPITGVFTSDAVEFSGLADACMGKDLIIRAYNSSGSELTLTDDSSSATVTYLRVYLATPSKNFVIASSAGGYNVNASIDMIDTTTADTNSFDLIFDPGTLTSDNTMLADARNVAKFTVETAPHK